MAFTCFSANLGCHFRSQTALGGIFAKIFSDFVKIFRDFARIFNKSKLLMVRLHTRLLHHWARPSAQVTMKTASQGFSNIVLNLF